MLNRYTRPWARNRTRIFVAFVGAQCHVNRRVLEKNKNVPSTHNPKKRLGFVFCCISIFFFSADLAAARLITHSNNNNCNNSNNNI